MYNDYSRERIGDEEKEGAAREPENQGGEATCEGRVVMNSAAFQAFMTGSASGTSEAWTIARLAGILGAKQADEHILVSHSFNIAGIEMEYEADEENNRVTVRCHVRTKERTGAETAALVGCGMALMVLVDSLRAIDRGMTIDGLRIVRQ